MRRAFLTSLMSVMVFISHLLAAQGAGKALIIGIEQYEKAPRLDFVRNDVKNLAEALSNRCLYDVTMVIDSAVDSRLDSIGPTTHRDAIMRRIEDWLAGIQPEDNAILYFSGHGFLDADGKLYLAVINCDPRNPSPGGIPVEWLREHLKQCRAARKVLLLDACHSGNARSNAVQSVSAKAIAVEFAGVEGITTLASCQGDENSYLWSQKEHSLFTYWLAQGLLGHADVGCDGEITFDELADFVSNNVSLVADMELGKKQTPVVVGDRNPNGALTLQVKPVELSLLISDMADQIDTQLRREEFPAVGIVPSFTCGETGQRLDPQFGMLPSYVAAELRRLLSSRGRHEYRIISENAMRETLQEIGAGLSDIGASKTRNLRAARSSEEIPIPSLVTGRIRRGHGPIVRVSCNLVDAKNMYEIGSAGGTAYLNESELAMAPDSVSHVDSGEKQRPTVAPAPGPKNRVRPRPQTSTGSGGAVAPAMPPGVVEAHQKHKQKAKLPHPLKDPNFPYRIAIYVKVGPNRYLPRELHFEGNQCFVTLDRGEVYAIWIENRTDHGVFLRLMVDGLNTLAQSVGVDESGIEVKPSEEKVVAPRVSLENAQAWHVDPDKINAVVGFHSNEEDTAYEFQVVDLEESAAASQGYTENIGLITAAFYKEKAKTRGRGGPSVQARDPDGGTKVGEKVIQVVEKYEGPYVPGDLLTVLHIRYVYSSDKSE